MRLSIFTVSSLPYRVYLIGMSTTAPLDAGVLIELPRDQAKTFFSTKGDEAVLEFVQHMLAEENTNCLNIEGGWKELAEAFGDEPPMAWCFTAGRPMHPGDSHNIMLIRPDMVGHVATNLSNATLSDLAGESYVPMLEKLRDHFDAAARAGSAMIFAVAN